MAKSAWTTKQRAFAELYLANGFKGTQAARDAKYKGNDVTLASVAYENLRKPHIKAYIDQRIKDMAMSADEALARLSMQARGSMEDFLTERRDSIDLAVADRADKLHLIKKFTHHISDKSETISVELYDAQAALALILKEQHLRAGEATEITDDASLTDEARANRINELLERARARRTR